MFCCARIVLFGQAAGVLCATRAAWQCRFDENDDMVLEPLEVKRLLCAPRPACSAACKMLMCIDYIALTAQEEVGVCWAPYMRAPLHERHQCLCPDAAWMLGCSMPYVCLSIQCLSCHRN